jgi:SPP1 gp7 family putative phage head morphogenesis protein
LEEAMTGLETWFMARSKTTGEAFAAWLTPALLAALLAGFADVQADSKSTAEAQRSQSTNAIATAEAQNAQSKNSEPNYNSVVPFSASSASLRWNQVSAGFDVKFQEAIDFFREKEVVTPKQFAALEAAARARAFSVAGMTDRYALDTIKESLQKAVETGQTANDWLTGIEDEFKSLGLSGVEDSAWHMRLIFRQNAYTGYAAGRYLQQQQVKRERPYLQYVTVGDDRVRPEHAALDGTIKPQDDPWWKTHYPPLGFGCRCLVVSVSRDELVAEGLDVTDDAEIADRYQQLLPGGSGMPPVDPRFAVDPAEAFGGLEDLS